MVAFLKGALKYLGYTAFFLLALIAFVYWTLPTDEVKAYLVRKASDEYNADLDITHLSTWGLAGVEAEGITFTPRPSPEQLAEIREARQARKAWEEAKKAKAEDAAKEKTEAAKGGAGDDEEGGDAKDLAEAVAKAKAAGDDAKGAAAKVAAGKKKPAAKDTKEAKEDKPPPIPAGPQPLLVESLRAKVSPFDLIGGVIDGRVEAALLGGTIEVDFNRHAEQLDVDAHWGGLDLAQLSVLRSVLPLPLVGGFEGQVDVEIPRNDKGQLRLASMTGTIDLKVADARIGPGRIESDKLGAFPYFDVPAVRVAELGGKLAFGKRRATFENFAFTGKDVEGEISGYIQLANDLKRWGPRAFLRFKFSDAFVKENREVKTAMSSIPYLRQGTDRDGFTGFAVTNTLASPKWRPRKTNPYRTTPRAARPAADKRPAKRPTRKPASMVDRKARVRDRAEELRRARQLGRPTKRAGDDTPDIAAIRAGKLKPTPAAGADDDDTEV
ncbi:MAG: type II secretion system protein GspN, partial [Myxococcales bacterium]|nr:type II secretion system protein GspN [Myxococcales bacterium]